MFQADAQLVEKIASKLKEEREDFRDREILNINRPVSVLWTFSGSGILIIALDDKGDFSEEHDFIDLGSFDGPPDYDKYGRFGSQAHFAEQFIEQANGKRLNGLFLTNFIQKDLIVTLEFSDGSKVIFDRYYKNIEENLDRFRTHFTTWGLTKMWIECFLSGRNCG